MSEPARRRQLGRGLAALFGETEIDAVAEAPAQRRIPIELIRPGAIQPRRRFAETELDALAQSIREKGILQPLLVRPLTGEEADFELVAGERRWRAAQRIGMHEVPVIVRPLGGWGIPKGLRVTIGKPEQNQNFLNALRRVLAKEPVR